MLSNMCSNMLFRKKKSHRKVVRLNPNVLYRNTILTYYQAITNKRKSGVKSTLKNILGFIK